MMVRKVVCVLCQSITYTIKHPKYKPIQHTQAMNFDTFKKIVLGSLQLPHKKEDVHEKDFVNCGYLHTYYIEEAVIAVMDYYVRGMDGQIRQQQKYSPRYKQLFRQRAFTFAEYRALFESNIKTDDFNYFKVFEFLRIGSEQHRKKFILNRRYDFEDYWAIIQKTQVSILPFFFRKIGVYFPQSVFKRHAYMPASTGSGKSELIKLLIYDLQRRSRIKKRLPQEKKVGKASIVLIEPHGDLANQVRDFDLNKDKKRLIYLNPDLKKGYTFVINPFEMKDKSERAIAVRSQQLTSAILDIMPKATLSLQMKALLIPCLTTLLRLKDTSFRDLQDFMHKESCADLVAEGMRSPNEGQRRFFRDKFADKIYDSTKASLYTKVQSLLNSSTFTTLVTGKSTIDLEAALNNGSIVIFSLSKTDLGADDAQAFGRFVIALIQFIGFKRKPIPEPLRMPTYVFIDEFQNYLSNTIKTVLAECRKFNIRMILANQNLAQLGSKEMKDTVLGNTNLHIVGENGVGTLSPMAKEIGVSVEKLQKIPQYSFYIKRRRRDALLFSTPDFLVGSKNKFMLSKDEVKELKRYFIEDSGYYKPIKQVEERPQLKPFHEEDADLSGRKPKPALDF